MSNRVLVIIDFFNPSGFSDTPKLAGAALVAARRTAALKVRLRQARVPVIYANDNFGHWQSNFSTLVAICKRLSGEAGQIADMLAPGPGDWSLLKPRHSAFYGTPLEFMLDELGARSLVLTGVMTDSCITMTPLMPTCRISMFGPPETAWLRLRRRKLAPPSFNLSASPERGADRAEVESRAKVAKRTLMRPSFRRGSAGWGSDRFPATAKKCSQCAARTSWGLPRHRRRDHGRKRKADRCPSVRRIGQCPTLVPDATDLLTHEPGGNSTPRAFS